MLCREMKMPRIKQKWRNDEKIIIIINRSITRGLSAERWKDLIIVVYTIRYSLNIQSKKEIPHEPRHCDMYATGCNNKCFMHSHKSTCSTL